MELEMELNQMELEMELNQMELEMELNQMELEMELNQMDVFESDLNLLQLRQMEARYALNEIIGWSDSDYEKEDYELFSDNDDIE